MKKQELSWKAGGQQGEGLESLGEIFAAALCSLGYDVYGYRQFSSRIKGGHTSYKLRIANHPVATIASSCNLLIAMDPDTLEVDAPELTAEGILVTDTAWLEGKKPKVRTVALSWNELSKADGTTLPKNILALGITAALLGIDTAKLLPLLEKQYGRKGAEVMETNRLALETGYEYIKNNYWDGIHIYDIAKYLCIDRSYVYLLFQKYFQQSPQDYLATFRLTKASELLSTTTLSM